MRPVNYPILRPQPVSGGSGFLTANLKLDFDVNLLGLSGGDTVTEMSNQIAGQNEGLQPTPANRSIVQSLTHMANSVPSGLGIVFDGSGSKSYSFGNICSSWTEGSFYFLLKLNALYTSGNITNGGAGAGNHYSYSGDLTYESLGSDTRISFTSASNLTSFHVYHITAKSGEYKIGNNGNSLYSSASNTVAFPSDLIVNSNLYLQALIVRMLGYDKAHTVAEVNQNIAAFRAAYGLTLA